MINCFIPVKNRDNTRLKRTIKAIRDSDTEFHIVDKIVIIDYGSTIPVKLDNVEILRIESNTWNKAHAINSAVLKYPSQYIMTLDADILIDKKHIDEIVKYVDMNTFIIDTNVRRIKIKDYCNSYENMVLASTPWGTNDRRQLFNQANGGIQVYSRYFFDKINGIMESLGYYSGSMDNYVYFMARLNGLNIIDMSYPLLHQEHKNQKEDNFPESERDMASGYRRFKGGYLDFIVKSNIKKNPEQIGKEQPGDSLFKKFKTEYDNREEIIQKAVDADKEEVALCGQIFKIEKDNPRILLTVINNRETLPDYFVWDLFNLYMHTKEIYPDIDIQPVKANEVSVMRNLSVKMAQGKDETNSKVYDYLVQLDSDHHYPPEFIVKFIHMMEKNKWDILTGLTPGKKPPYKNTQYHKFFTPIDVEGNHVECPEPKDERIQIEASGPVGMVIRTSVFDKLEFPYYNIEYGKKDETDKNGLTFTKDTLLGSDLYFCKCLKEKGIKIMLDLNTNFPHGKNFFLSRGKIVYEC